MGDLGPMPILQDTVEADVWSSFNTAYRDVLILDANGERVTAFNLTSQDLGDPANYEALRTLFIDAASNE